MKQPHLHHLGQYRATVRIRHDPSKFGPVRAEMEKYEGVTAIFREMWFIDCDEDKFANTGYDGEHAMECPHGWPVGWIASGDLANIKRLLRLT